MGGVKKMEEGDEQEQRKQQRTTQQEEHKTRTTLNILVTSGPGVKKGTMRKPWSDLAPLFWSSQCLCRRQKEHCFAAHCRPKIACSISMSSPMGVTAFVCIVGGTSIFRPIFR